MVHGSLLPFKALPHFRTPVFPCLSIIWYYVSYLVGVPKTLEFLSQGLCLGMKCIRDSGFPTTLYYFSTCLS